MSSKKKAKNKSKNEAMKKDVFSSVPEENMDLTEPEAQGTEPEPAEQSTEEAPTEQNSTEEQLSGNSAGCRENAVIRWLSSVITGFRGMQKETRNFVLALSAVGIAFAVAVIVLAVRLDKAKEEIASIQAVSLGLQEELNLVKSEQDEMELQLFGIETAFTDEILMREPEPTVTPVPTSTPTPAPTNTPTPEPPKYVVCVDAGHGGKDGGAVLRVDGTDKRVEKKDNLRMAKWFRDALEEYGIRVVMTREDDTFLELSERTDIANEADADVLISFHRNSFDGRSDVGGVEFWIHSSKPEKARLLAQGMLDAITEVGGMNDRGVKYGRIDNTKEDYAINKRAEMTSMIVELGFVSCEEDNTAYDTYGEEYAKEMAKVVYEWLTENTEKE